MSYFVYTTDAVILKKADVGEADKLFSFFTKDFGRLEIKAQGVRYLKSKLRYHLSGYSVLKISFVGGNGEYWRLVGAQEEKIFSDIKQEFLKTACAERILKFVERMVQGQEKDEKLWMTLFNSLTFLDNHVLAKPALQRFEERIYQELLALLGYEGQSVERVFEESML